MRERRRCALYLFVTASVLSGGNSALASPVADAQSALESKAHFIKQMQTVLDSAGLAGRIYYHALCDPNEVRPNTFPQSIRFPQISVGPWASGRPGLATVRAMLRGNREVVVTEGPDGVIRIRIGHTPAELLKTHISTVAFTREEQYDARSAIAAIFHTREVTAAVAELNTRSILRMEDYINAYPHEGAPHLPPVLGDMTLDQALDEVAITFRGIIDYGACTQPHVFDVNFYPAHSDR